MLQNRMVHLSHFQNHPKCICFSNRNMDFFSKWDFLKQQPKNTAHPTDSATALVESSETNTWQANLWSAGCFVIKPKYLQMGKKEKIQRWRKLTQRWHCLTDLLPTLCGHEKSVTRAAAEPYWHPVALIFDPCTLNTFMTYVTVLTYLLFLGW